MRPNVLDQLTELVVNHRRNPLSQGMGRKAHVCDRVR